MHENQWFYLVFRRFFLSIKQERSFLPVFSTFVGITLGVVTLFMVLAVMNGFQQGFIGSINEVGTYHLVVSPSQKNKKNMTVDESFIQNLEGIPEITGAYPFASTKTVIESSYSGNRGLWLKGVLPSVWEKDEGFRSRMDMVEGEFDLKTKEDALPALILGRTLAHYLGVSVDDTVSVLIAAFKRAPRLVQMRVSGIMSTGYYEYDGAMGLIHLEEMQKLGLGQDLQYGIKIENIWKDLYVLNTLESKLTKDWEVASWRDFNRAFFGALRVEKTTMLLLLSLVFVIIALHLHHALARSIEERLQELATLLALGIDGYKLRLLFMTMSLFITSLGIGFGLLIGWQLATHLSFFTEIINEYLFQWNLAGQLFTVPTEIIASDLKYIIIFPLLCSFFSTLRATLPLVRFSPIEVLHYE